MHIHIHLHIRRWVVWWFYVGVICGALAVVNIIGHHLVWAQDRLLILLGIAHWLLGGIVCWAFDGIRMTRLPQTVPEPPHQPLAGDREVEFYAPSTFLLPGSRRNLLPWRH